MANEFIARKGLIALDDSTISGSLTVEKSGSTVFEVVGSTGQLFSIEDRMQGSLFAVSDISGLPILEVFSDDKIVAGAYGKNTFVINDDKVGVGTDTPDAPLHISSSDNVLLSLESSDGLAYISFRDNTTADINTVRVGAAGGDLQFIAGGSEAIRIKNNQRVGIGTSSPTELLHINGGNVKIETGDLYIEDTFPTIFFSETNDNPDFSLNLNNGQFKITDTTNNLTRVIVNETGNVGIGGGFNPTQRLQVSGSITLRANASSGSEDFSNITGTPGRTVIKDVIASQAYEDTPFINTETINAFAGADKWAAITASNVYKNYTTHSSVGQLQDDNPDNLPSSLHFNEMFRAGGKTFQPFFSGALGEELDEIVIEVNHENEPLRYHSMVGIQFTHPNWRARRIKIEAYTQSHDDSGTDGWVTALDVNNQSEATVGTYVNAQSGGIRKTKFTLGRPANSNNASRYVRISKIFGYDYKGVSEADEVKTGTYYLGKHDNTAHYGTIYPATGSVDLGKSNAKYSSIYADTLYGTASHALNVPENTGFPFTGSAGIQGNLSIDQGKIGIGVASPEYNLDIQGDSPVLRIADDNVANSTSASFIWMGENGNSEARGAGLHYDGHNNQLHIVTTNDGTNIHHPSGSIPRITIKENRPLGAGRVGIGTAAPLFDLHVSGSGSDSGRILLEKSTNDAIIESRTNTAGAYFRANSKGNANYYGLELYNHTTAKWFLGSYGDSDFHITEGAKSGTDQRITIKNSTGKVGIGTKNPQESLTTTGNILVTASNSRKIEVSVNNYNDKAQFQLRALRSGTNSQNEPLGMGPSTLFKSGAHTYFDTDEDFRVRPNNDEALTVKGSGDIEFISSSGDGNTTYLIGDAGKGQVGIGTTTLTETLTVSGGADITGSVSITENLTVSQSITADTLTLLGLSLIENEALVISGNNIFGDTATNTHEFIGTITASGDISASGGIQVGTGTFKGSAEAAKTDAALVIPQNSKIYTLDNNGQHLRNLISKDTGETIHIGQNTVYIDEIRLSPGANGFTSFYSGSANTEVARIDAGGNITASGNVSSSGQFLGANFGLDNTDKLQFSDATLQFRLNDASQYTMTQTVFRPTADTGSSLGRSANRWDELVVNNITASGTVTIGTHASSSVPSGSIFEVVGSSGQLFSIEDGFSGSLFAVSDVSGLPILEVFSDDRVIAGAYNQNDFVISGSRVGIGTNTPNAKLDVIGNISSSGTGSMPYLMLGGATSLTEGSTRLEVNGQINVNGTDGGGSTGTVRSFRGKFNKINNRASGNDIIEFTTGNNVSILGPVTASNNISASGEIRGQKFIADYDGTIGGYRFVDPNDGNIDNNRITLSSANNMQFKADGVFQFSNGHVQVLRGNQLTLSDGENQSKFKIQNISADTGSGDENNTTLAIKNESGTSLLTISGSGNTNLAGNLEIAGNLEAYTSSVVMGEYAIQALTTSGPKINFGSTTDLSKYMRIGAFSGTNNVDTKTRDFHIYSDSHPTGAYFDASTGKLGLGTKTPTGKLEIYASGSQFTGSNAALLLRAVNDDISFRIGQPTNYGFEIKYKGTDSGNDNDLEFLSDGVTHASEGGIKWMDVKQSGEINLGSGSAMFFPGSGSSYAGKVGIGTTTPSELLEVSGNIHIDGVARIISDISSSGALFASLSLDNNTSFKTVMYDTASGKFTFTGSYGGGSSGGGADGYIGDNQNHTAGGNLDMNGNNITNVSSILSPQDSSGLTLTLASDETLSISAEEIAFNNTDIRLSTDGHITASGEISASSAIFGNLKYNENGTTLINSTSDLNHVSESAISRGDIVKFGNTTTVAGRLYYYGYSGTWETGSQTDITARSAMLGIALGTNSDNDGMIIRGIAHISGTVSSLGSQVYMGSTSGSITSTAPTTANSTLRSVGHSIKDNTIYFNPSPDYIIIK